MGSAKLEKNCMSYAILRTRKISTPAQMSGMQRHNDRTNNVRNCDPELKGMNRTLSITKTEDLRTDIEFRIKEANVKVRKNSVLAIEHLMTFSPDFVKTRKGRNKKGEVGLVFVTDEDFEKWKTFKNNSIKWLQDTYGKDNLVHVSIHLDEKTPHLHAYVVPIVNKTIKWKNAKGSGEREVNSLCARDFTGGKKKLQEMQNEFALVHEEIGLIRGEKNSKAKHEDIKKYYGRVNEAMNSPKPKIILSNTSVEIPRPPRMGNLDDYTETLKQSIEELVKKEREEAVKAYLENSADDLLIARESASLIRMIERENRQEILKKNSELDSKEKAHKEQIENIKGELAKTKLSQRKALEIASEEQKRLDSWRKVTENALKNKDPKSIQLLMNYFDNPKKKGLKRQ